MDDLQLRCKEIISKISNAKTLNELDVLKSQSLGKTGIVNDASAKLPSLGLEDRKILGSLINSLKNEITEALSAKKLELDLDILNKKLAAEKVDISLPSLKIEGSIHPLSHVIQELIAILGTLGFKTAFGPEIEDDYYNFAALNIEEDHPARGEQDTFYLGESVLLRTHSSTVQIRTLKNNKPPVRIVSFGRVYRADDLDATHTPMFHQLEGLYIDRNVNMGHLKFTLLELLRNFFETDDVQIRLRPSFFPFTEPSMEVDILCSRTGNKIKIGEGNDWLEVLGCGMVHPNVLAQCDISSIDYQGFAFGLGIERLAMLKYGINDIRTFYDGSKRWHDHYSFSWVDMPTLFGGLS